MSGRRPPLRRRRRTRPLLAVRGRRMPIAMTLAQARAWEVCLAIDTGLLPALRRPEVDRQEVRSHLGGVALRIVRYCSGWGELGPMMLAALHCSMRLYGMGEHEDLAGLMKDVSDRLYRLCAGPAGGEARQ